MSSKHFWGMNYLKKTEEVVSNEDVILFLISDEEFKTNPFLNELGLKISYLKESIFKKCLIVNAEEWSYKQFSKDESKMSDELVNHIIDLKFKENKLTN